METFIGNYGGRGRLFPLGQWEIFETVDPMSLSKWCQDDGCGHLPVLARNPRNCQGKDGMREGSSNLLSREQDRQLLFSFYYYDPILHLHQYIKIGSQQIHKSGKKRSRFLVQTQWLPYAYRAQGRCLKNSSFENGHIYLKFPRWIWSKGAVASCSTFGVSMCQWSEETDWEFVLILKD